MHKVRTFLGVTMAAVANRRHDSYRRASSSSEGARRAAASAYAPYSSKAVTYEMPLRRSRRFRTSSGAEYKWKIAVQVQWEKASLRRFFSGCSSV